LRPDSGDASLLWVTRLVIILSMLYWCLALWLLYLIWRRGRRTRNGT
jgi:hypothetical protein